MTTFVGIGDSLTKNPVGHLPAVLGPDDVLLLRARNGAQTAEVLDLLTADPLDASVDVVVVGVGTNDVLHEEWDLPTFRSQVSAILDRAPAPVVVLTTLPRRLGQRPAPVPMRRAKLRRVEAANACIRDLARERGGLILELDDLRHLGSDRTHPTAEGVRVTAERLAGLLSVVSEQKRQGA